MEDEVKTMFDTNEPPIWGELRFEVDHVPSSIQSKGDVRRAFEATIRQRTQGLDYLLSGDVAVEIEWFVHERTRYERDSSPDIDNIIKPLLDAFAGPEGVLIDDCQVQSLGVTWIDWLKPSQHLRIIFKFLPDEWMRKPIRFLRTGDALCLPIEGDLPRWLTQVLIRRYAEALDESKLMDEVTGNFHISRALLPVHRLFHATRIRGFPILSLAELTAEQGR